MQTDGSGEKPPSDPEAAGRQAGSTHHRQNIEKPPKNIDPRSVNAVTKGYIIFLWHILMPSRSRMYPQQPLSALVGENVLPLYCLILDRPSITGNDFRE